MFAITTNLFSAGVITCSRYLRHWRMCPGSPSENCGAMKRFSKIALILCALFALASFVPFVVVAAHARSTSSGTAAVLSSYGWSLGIVVLGTMVAEVFDI